uniref:Uncharacterized protein n=1 Tax=Acrobeloides nanus TaxID=290746 RepID=A0A914BXF9_9BILA
MFEKDNNEQSRSGQCKCLLSTHPQYLKKFQEIEKTEEANNDVMKQRMGEFYHQGKGELSALDRKVVDYIAYMNQSFSIDEEEILED